MLSPRPLVVKVPPKAETRKMMRPAATEEMTAVCSRLEPLELTVEEEEETLEEAQMPPVGRIETVTCDDVRPLSSL